MPMPNQPLAQSIGVEAYVTDRIFRGRDGIDRQDGDLCVTRLAGRLDEDVERHLSSLVARRHALPAFVEPVPWAKHLFPTTIAVNLDARAIIEQLGRRTRKPANGQQRCAPTHRARPNAGNGCRASSSGRRRGSTATCLGA